MKKILSLIVVGLFCVAGQRALASGIFESFLIIDINGGGNSFYDLDSATVNPDLSGANLGAFDPATDSLNISGGQIRTFEDPDAVDDATGAQVFWRIYKTGDAPGGFVSWGLAQIGPQVLNDRTWEATDHVYNELTGLTPGTYNLEAYGEAYFHFDDHQGNVGDFTAKADKSGANHIATFTVIPEPTAFVLAALGVAGAGLLLRRKN